MTEGRKGGRDKRIKFTVSAPSDEDDDDFDVIDGEIAPDDDDDEHDLGVQFVAEEQEK